MNKIISSVIANPLKRMKQSLLLSFLSSVIASVAKQSLFLSLRGRTMNAAIFFFLTIPSFALAEEKIPVFPTSPVEAYTVYATLAILWLGIIGLIVIIKMKLNEIERIQKLGIDNEDTSTPILE